MSNIKQPTVSAKELKRLYKNSIRLECLMSMGVDNWVGYEEAMEDAAELIKEDLDNAQ